MDSVGGEGRGKKEEHLGSNLIFWRDMSAPNKFFHHIQVHDHYIAKNFTLSKQL